MSFDIVIGGDAQPDSFDIVIGTELAAGTTLDALQAGSGTFKWVVAIEGYEHLLTDADRTTDAVNAWLDDTGTHYYASAVGGLFVDIENEQRLETWNPFGGGGRCTLHVVPTSTDDTFGVDTHKRSGVETELSASIDRDDTTITVKSTANFPSSGEAHIGTECFAYTGKTGTTFTGCTRGKYIPFPNGNTGIGFAQAHPVGQNPLEVKFNPTVSASPRTWIGRWVGVWLHKFDASIPALNSRLDAQCVYAGKIVAVSDNPSTGATVVELKHVLDVVGDSTLAGRDQWKGQIRNSIHLEAGFGFYMRERAGVGTYFADPLMIVPSGATGANEVNAGEYTAAELFAKLNTWLDSEKRATNITGDYSFGFFEPADGERSVYVWWSNGAVSSSDAVHFQFGAPPMVLQRLGFDNMGELFYTAPGGEKFIVWTTSPPDYGYVGGDVKYTRVADHPYLRLAIHQANHGHWTSTVDNTEGTFVDQYDSLPSSVKPAVSGGDEWGVFLVDGTTLVYGIKDGSTVRELKLLPEQFGYKGGFGLLGQVLAVVSKSGEPDFTRIQQVYALEMPLGAALVSFFLSTGTEDYNDASFDSLGLGLGLAIPASLCSGLLGSINKLPAADKPIVVIIDKTTRFRDIFAGDLNLRRGFLRWNNQSLEFTQWKAPVEGNSVAILSESNKAAPAGSQDHHRAVTVENGSWARPIVKIKFNRSANEAGEDSYRDSITIIDKVALNDMGGEGPTLTILARNTYGAYAATGASVEALAPGFMSTMPMLSRPARQTSRSIDVRFFEGVSIGDIVGFTDEYARDPDTGLRGVQTRYAIVTKHYYTLGGLTPGATEPNPMGGGVDLFMLDVNRMAYYAPSAQVDDTQANAGYNAGTGALTVYAHKFSESFEAVDASRFSNGMKIRIVEIDPSDPAAPLQWDRTISTVVGNVITPTATLSSPAWDATKKYRITFDDYADCTASQQLGYTFMGDDADAMIVDSRVPFQYAAGGAEASYTAWTAADDVELIPNSTYVDGAPRDVGHDVALVRLLNNLVSYKTAVSSPFLVNDIMSGEPLFGTWALVMATPIHLGDDVLLNDVWRRVAVAPHFRSDDGTVANLRVTLARNAPSGVEMVDADRGFIYSEVTFTTSSTTWSTPSPDNLVANMKGSDGTAWLLIECSGKCLTRGLAHVQEGPLLY